MVEFLDLNDLQAMMCFECDSVWGMNDRDRQAITDYESLMKLHDITADWSRINKLSRVR